MVDIARPPEIARRRKIRRLGLAAAVVVAVIAISAGVSQMKPAAPTVERATVWVDTVKRGPMLRQVRGTGTLVPEEIRWIPAQTEGRVERRVVEPGTAVTPDTVILELSNPELQRTVRDAELALTGAVAAYENQKAQLQSQLLNQRAQAAQVAAEYLQARLQAEADEELAQQGIVSQLTVKLSRSKADQLENRDQIERQRVEIAEASMKEQLAVQESAVAQSRTLYELRRQQLDALRVRAGIAGVLQVLPVEVGQQVATGANLARVANPNRLKAELRIAETQTKDVAIGQVAEIDTRNGVVPGRVIRIDPSAQSGTIGVDVALQGDLPRGARADVTVDGTIELERLDQVVFVGRPAFGQEHSTVSLFKLQADGREAIRTPVKLGRSSVNTIEIVGGLEPGDQVILSDMSAQDAFDRIRLN
jgi:HlyD family secretion protein